MYKNKRLTIGYTTNKKTESMLDNPEFDEWESPESLEGIIKAFEKTGNKVILIDANPNKSDIYKQLKKYKIEIDIVFNRVEEVRNIPTLRQAFVPMFCEYLNIPYCGSGPQAIINAMNKATTKEIVTNYNILTPNFQIIKTPNDTLNGKLQFPLIVKPIGEGSSIGLTQESKVDNHKELVTQVKKITERYQQPALIEEFVDGDEYTIGIIGDYILPILKIPFDDLPDNPVVRDPQVKNIETPFMTVMPYDEEGYLDLARQTAIVFEALSCNDYCRMDLREKNRIPYFL